MTRIIFILSLIALIVSAVHDNASAQKEFDNVLVVGEGEDELLADANFFFYEGNYSTAAQLFEKLFVHFEGRFEYKVHLGICYTYTPTKTDQALTLLEEIYAEYPATKDILYYLGKAYHLNHKFDEALDIFEKAKADKKLTQKQEEHVERLIINCNNGKEIIKDPLDIAIENLGPPVNSQGSEYVPVISSDESVLIFTYTGERSLGGLQNAYGEEHQEGYYYEDVQISYKLKEAWLAPENIGFNINSLTHDACIALSGDGQTLFVYKYSEDGGGDIFQSQLVGEEWSPSVQLNNNINTSHWEGSASLSPDGMTLYFTSERPGGQGGKDIYLSRMRDDGVWGEAENIGRAINTAHHDDAPFMHPDGKTLYFSSQGHFNMGNYDVFKTEWDGEAWSEPQNMGYPLNTAGDDMFYVVSANGERGYFSSGRPGGMGKQDIYIAHLDKIKHDHALIMLRGIVTANDSAVAANITVKDSDNNVVQGNYSSNASTGSYLVSLPVGKDYSVYYDVEGHETHIKNVKGSEAVEFKELVVDVDLYSDGYKPSLTLDGSVLYHKSPARPAVRITVYIKDKSGNLVKRETETDSRGYFKFTNVPANAEYVLSIDEKDPDLKAYVHPVIVGKALLRGQGVKDIKVNGVITDSNGSFKIELKEDNLLSSNLPESKEELEQVDFSDPDVYQEVLDKYGSIATDGLVFKIQVGAYKSTKPVDYSHLTGLGEVTKKMWADGLMRYTIGELRTLRDSEELKNKAIRKGQGDAFILIFYKGEKRLLSEVVANGFYKS